MYNFVQRWNVLKKYIKKEFFIYMSDNMLTLDVVSNAVSGRNVSAEKAEKMHEVMSKIEEYLGIAKE